MKKEIIKPFDFEKAKNGAKLQTKDGDPVEIFKWDARGRFPIKGMVIGKEEDKSASWKHDGAYNYMKTSESPLDLVIVEEVEEPKFSVGDFVKHGYYPDDTYIIKSVDLSGDYELDSVDGKKDKHIAKATEDVIRLWDVIKDAKAGDVLVASDGSTFLFAGVDDCTCKYYVVLTTGNVLEFNEGLKHFWETSSATKPATKEQRELLLSKLKEAGYEWNADALELKKVKPEFWSDNKSNTFEGFFIGTYGDIIEVSKLSNTVSNYNIFATKKQAKSALAMARISQIMANDIENFGGVVTDEEWDNAEWKFVIYRCDNQIKTTSVVSAYHFLAFHTEKQRDLFLEKYPQLVHDFLMITDEETK